MANTQEKLNLRALDHPRVGDKWYDHGTLQVKVLKITAMYIHIQRGGGGGGIMEKLTPTQFKKLLLYETIPNKTWADVE